MMKNLLLLIFVITAAILPAAAGRPDRPDPKMLKEIQEYKMKYLAQEMELNDEQKDKFIELYTKMSKERYANFERMKALERTLKDNPSEADYKAATEGMADVKLKDATIEKQYDSQFAKFLSQKQIYRMKESEEKFRRKMHDMHHKRKGAGKCNPDNARSAERGNASK